MRHDDCLFCKIIDGELPSAKVYEDKYVYAFMDISQVTEGHTLVIPKKHTKNIYETDEETAKEFFGRIPKVASAIKKAFNPVGLNILNNNDILAGQTVYHLHLHLIPRYDEHDGFGFTWQMKRDDYSQEELKDLAKKISKEID